MGPVWILSVKGHEAMALEEDANGKGKKLATPLVHTPRTDGYIGGATVLKFFGKVVDEVTVSKLKCAFLSLGTSMGLSLYVVPDSSACNPLSPEFCPAWMVQPMPPPPAPSSTGETKKRKLQAEPDGSLVLTFDVSYDPCVLKIECRGGGGQLLPLDLDFKIPKLTVRDGLEIKTGTVCRRQRVPSDDKGKQKPAQALVAKVKTTTSFAMM